jgi:hypothetical protein
MRETKRRSIKVWLALGFLIYKELQGGAVCEIDNWDDVRRWGCSDVVQCGEPGWRG